MKGRMSNVIPVLVLSLGIGATTAIFSIIEAALLRTLPGVRKADEMVLLVGLVFGVGAALAVTRFLASLVYEVSPHDSLTFTVVCVTLCVVAFVANEAPARRAARIEPSRALRQE